MKLFIFSFLLILCIQSLSVIACPENEYSRGCGSPCDPTCDEPNPICLTVCVSRCECKPGYVRHPETNKCIEKKDCPKKNSFN
uniref:TIL domain-containing protein n=1 Tax=Caenorhabditis tropicalis TaxID=1561998 RepID=A0A1I7TYW4_9PELO